MAKKSILQKNSFQRKAEEQKLKLEQDDIDRKTKEIEILNQKLQEKEHILHAKEQDMKRHEKFTEFLKKVVDMKDGDKEGFENIPDLQNRFKSLKNENK